MGNFDRQMAIGFTEEQTRAITTLDKSVLVSAAAGSGKTAVLVQRIVNIVLEGKADVDEMLVVTFTKAAASEMKQRLSAALRARMREHPEESGRLREQLGKMYQAYISTVHSFAQRVIKEFFYEADIEPDFSICDEIQSELLRREAVNELFEDGFGNDELIEGFGFREFLRLYSEERSDEIFKDNLLAAYSALRTIPDYFSWAYEKAENLRVTPETFDGSEIQRIMSEDAKDCTARVLDACRRVRSLFEEAGLEEMYAKLAPETEQVMGICEKLNSERLTPGLIDACAAIKSVTLRATKDQKESYDAIKSEVSSVRKAYKEELNKWRERYAAPDLETRLKEMNDTYEYTVYYIRLLEEFEKRYEAKKKERRMMDFSDMEHYAVRILDNENAASILRRRFKYIFVDEYQDTNNIQEYLIGRISRPDNVFKVGDVKQSIYKFRQAEPELFERLYRRYSDPEETNGVTIDLSMNFRTNDATIRYINRVFEEIMEGYDEKSRLYTGVSCDPAYDFIPEVHVLSEEAADGPVQTDDEEPAADDEIEDLSKEEAEAEYAADLAASLIGTEFYDTKLNQVRKATPRDIVILLRAVRLRGDIYARALRSRRIEAHVEESDDYFDTVEISVAMSLLSCVDNMKRDVPLIAALHSEAFGWTAGELARIRIAHDEHGGQRQGRQRPAFYEALEWYLTGGPDAGLREKAGFACGKIREWRRLSRMMPLEDFVWHVLTDSGYYNMAGAMNGGAARQANLRFLADKAAAFSKGTVASLSAFIAFVEVMKSKKISNGQAKAAGSDDDVVRIATIHKSKGLEYPFVIVGGLGHRFRYDTNAKKLSFDSELGVSLPYIDPSRKYWRSTILARAINSKSRRDEYKEELRILYVAMTRARNKLIMVGSCRDEAKLREYSARPGDFLTVMRDVLSTPYNTYHVAPLNRNPAASGPQRMKNAWKSGGEDLMPEAAELYAEVERRLNYVYPDQDLLTAKAKYSVSAVRREELEMMKEKARSEAEPESGEDTEASAQFNTHDDEVVVLWNNTQNRKRAGAADTGIAYHRIMEFLDFGRAAGEDGTADRDYIRERAEYLLEHEAIEEDVFRSVDLGRISEFFESGLGRRAAAADRAGTLRKEKAFTLSTERQGRKMLIQGVIDCCFEEDGRMIVIDYKSSLIRPDRSRESEIRRIQDEYRVQIELYSEAVAKGTGKPVSEAYLYLFATGDAVKMM